MRKTLPILFSIISFFGIAQSPQKMSYQAVIRDASNNLVRDATVGMQISLLQGSSSGTVVYVETHTPTTSTAGVVSLEIGNGTVVSGTFSSIDWSNGPYFVQTETDPDGGTAYNITVTSQLLSVPYALYAENSGYTETDPLFDESVAKGITAADTLKWNNAGSSNTITEVYDNDFKIINSSGIAGNPLAAPNTFLAGFGVGNVNNGTHDYVVTYVTSAGETGAGPASGAVTVTDNTSNGQVLLTNLPVSSDGSVTARNIYRRFDGSGTYYYLTTINDNSTASYLDNIANASLGGSLPGSNSTERSIQFLASGLSGNRTYTLPDVSGKLVIDEGSISLKTVADKSLNTIGKSLIQQLANGNYSRSADANEFVESFEGINGVGTSVSVSYDQDAAIFDLNENQYIAQTPDLREHTLHDPNSLLNPLFAFDDDGSTGATKSNFSGTVYLGKIFNEEQYIGVVKIIVDLYSNASSTVTNGVWLETYDGTNWNNFSTVNYLSSGSETMSVSKTVDLNQNVLGLRLRCQSSGVGYYDGYQRIRMFQFGIPRESNITHNIPSGTFSNNLSKVFSTAVVSKWDDQANIQFKLTNASEESGWLDYNKSVEFTPFSSEPLLLILKLIPEGSPGFKAPAIKGFYITEL